MGEWRVALVALLTVLRFAELWQQASAEDCFWDSRCQNLWMGGCGNGYVAVQTSNDCQGLCAVQQYEACPLFFTRFQCCREGRARLSSTCSKCPNKKDIGSDWICCSDCSEPFITEAKSKFGYCQTDAYLSVQPKPRELFKWHARSWTTCSGKCKKAKRTREIQCLRYMENDPHLVEVVENDKCPNSAKPSHKERCIPRGCKGSSHHKRRKLPAWAIVLISLTCLTVVGGLAFAGFIIYRRRNDSSNHGFVYVMLDNY